MGDSDVELVLEMLVGPVVDWAQVTLTDRRQLRVRGDVPGSLARITAIVSDAGGNIDEVHHQRAFTLLAAQNVEIELVLQTRGRDHLQAVLQALRAAGFEAEEQ